MVEGHDANLVKQGAREIAAVVEAAATLAGDPEAPRTCS